MDSGDLPGDCDASMLADGSPDALKDLAGFLPPYRCRKIEIDLRDKRKALKPMMDSHPVLGGHRFVHLVLQGGGTLGIAHLGALYALEHLGFRFAGLAGTSAGAILCTLIAAARANWSARCATELLPILQSLPSDEFIDGPTSCRTLIKRSLPRVQLGKDPASDTFHTMRAFAHLFRTHGFNSGERFRYWLKDVLENRFGITTTDGLLARMENTPDAAKLGPLDGQDILKLPACALPVGARIIFPRDRCLFKQREWERQPEIFARASMSIPIFFEPLELELDASAWFRYVAEQAKESIVDGRVTGRFARRTLQFVDGGLLSNFPIDAHLPSNNPGSWPSALNSIPVFGIAIGTTKADQADEPERKSATSLMQNLALMVDSARHVRDLEAARLLRPCDRILYIGTGAHNWLNFMLDGDASADLFQRGVDAVIGQLN